MSHLQSLAAWLRDGSYRLYSIESGPEFPNSFFRVILLRRDIFEMERVTEFADSAEEAIRKSLDRWINGDFDAPGVDK